MPDDPRPLPAVLRDIATPEAISGCVWVSLQAGRCQRPVAPGGLCLCAEHRAAAERREWRAP